MHDATSVCRGLNFYESLKRAPIQINNFTNKTLIKPEIKNIAKVGII